MKPPSQGKLLYHITHIDNMQSILNHGLLSRNELKKRGISGFKDIADHEILSKRAQYKENLSKYVLFHFYAKNPFDCAVCNEHGVENLAIITLLRELHTKNNFKIIPSHPLDRNEPEILPYNEGIQRIQWDILDNSADRDYSIDNIRKACMAECIMDYRVQPEVFHFVFVYNETGKSKIKDMDNSDKIDIKVAPYMFYKKTSNRGFWV